MLASGCRQGVPASPSRAVPRPPSAPDLSLRPGQTRHPFRGRGGRARCHPSGTRARRQRKPDRVARRLHGPAGAWWCCRHCSPLVCAQHAMPHCMQRGAACVGDEGTTPTATPTPLHPSRQAGFVHWHANCLDGTTRQLEALEGEWDGARLRSAARASPAHGVRVRVRARAQAWTSSNSAPRARSARSCRSPCGRTPTSRSRLSPAWECD